jgi:hypothetical protein
LEVRTRAEEEGEVELLRDGRFAGLRRRHSPPSASVATVRMSDRVRRILEKAAKPLKHISFSHSSQHDCGMIQL